MGITISKHAEVKTKDQDNEKNDITNIERDNPVRENKANIEKSVRFSNDDDEQKFNASSDLRRVPLVVTHTGNRPKFYYYPNKQTSTSSAETCFVPTSQFPYKKPKAIFVRPRNQGIEDQLQVNPLLQIRGAISERLRYARYDSVTGAPDAHRDQRMHISKIPHRSHQSVNERHWASSHVLPTNNHAPDRIIPHRTVAELRRSAITCPTMDANYYSGEQFQRHCVEIEPGVNRPPTPIPTVWFPATRTEDYLVASSLLASEHDLDRRRAVARDVHDF